MRENDHQLVNVERPKVRIVDEILEIFSTFGSLDFVHNDRRLKLAQVSLRESSSMLVGIIVACSS
jgi:hypothetical protein